MRPLRDKVNLCGDELETRKQQQGGEEWRGGSLEGGARHHDGSGWQGDVNAMAVISFTLPLSCPAVLMS